MLAPHTVDLSGLLGSCMDTHVALLRENGQLHLHSSLAQFLMLVHEHLALASLHHLAARVRALVDGFVLEEEKLRMDEMLLMQT